MSTISSFSLSLRKRLFSHFHRTFVVITSLCMRVKKAYVWFLCTRIVYTSSLWCCARCRTLAHHMTLVNGISNLCFSCCNKFKCPLWKRSAKGTTWVKHKQEVKNQLLDSPQKRCNRTIWQRDLIIVYCIALL